MSRDPVLVRSSETLEQVAAKMHRLKVSGFAVVDEADRLVGVVTERDLGRGLGQGAGSTTPTTFLDLLSHSGFLEDRETLAVLRGRFRRIHVETVMTRHPATVAPDTSLAEAARLIADRGLHRLPVVEGERVVGIISYRDVLREFSPTG